MRTLCLLYCLIFSASLMSQTPAFDPRSWKGAHAGPPTEVLTLASTHLSEMQQRITPAMMEPLLAKLMVFKPQIITHEGISGQQCEQLRQYKATYVDMWSSYCWGTDQAEMATGLTVSAAMAEIERLLSTWPSVPSAAQRRRMAAVFLAAGDRPSAQVQWLQLKAEERMLGDGIDADLFKILNRTSARSNETYDIAVALAARLGLNRVYAVDDHTADSITSLAEEGYAQAIQKHFESARGNKLLQDFATRQGKVKTPAHMLALYRTLNQGATQIAFIKNDFAAALRQETPQQFGRQYVAWMETRNLRMVANIRAAFGNQPGARVLNIVGASHKAYYDAYLDMMHEVRLVDAERILE